MGAPLQITPAHDAGGHMMHVIGTTDPVYPRRASTSPYGGTTTAASGDFHTYYTGATAFTRRVHIVIDRINFLRKPAGNQSILVEVAVNNGGSVSWEELGTFDVTMDVNRWVPNGCELGVRVASFDPVECYGFRVTSSSTTAEAQVIWRQLV
jgi:hypothetical protein